MSGAVPPPPPPPRRPRDSWHLRTGPATAAERLVAGGFVLAVAAIAAVLAARHPGEIPGMPRCPSVSLLGVQCPGCGSTRASHFLLQGDLARAWRMNPALVLLGLPVLATALVDAGRTLVRGRRLLAVPPSRTALLLAGLLVLWGALRNVPAFPGLRPPGA